jgi:hypothetical protein
MSMLASPAIPERPNRCLAPRDSHTIDELMIAPGSTVLNGVDLHAGIEHGMLTDEALVPQHDAFLAARTTT